MTRSGLLDPAAAIEDYVERRPAAILRLLRTAPATAAYCAAHNNAMPDDLLELVPEYIDAVPVDPYDGRPLKCAHAPEGCLVYSVGPDGVDDGGRGERTVDAWRRPTPDLVLLVPRRLPPPKAP